MSLEFAGVVAFTSAAFGVAGFFFSQGGVSKVWSTDKIQLIKHVSIGLFVGGMVLLLWLGSM